MIDGVNDTPEQAGRLAGLARGWRCHVNLIPLNPTPGSPWSGTPRTGIDAFVAVLRGAGVAVTVRDTRGREIEAACGQLHAQLAGRPLRGVARPAATLAGA
jgi:23S rRNA (adenine2503-C2)-methyltransferase